MKSVKSFFLLAFFFLTLTAEAQVDSVEMYINKAKDHLRNHAFDSALIYSKGAEQLAARAGKVDPNVNYVLSVSYYKIGLSDRAIEEGLESIRVAEQEQDYVLVGQVCVHLGILFTRVFDTTKALYYLQRALEISEQVDKPLMRMDAIGNMAETYNKKGDDKKYYACLREAMALSREMKDTLFIGYHCNNLAGYFTKTGNYDSAIIYCRKAIQIEQQTGIFSGIALGNMGELYRRLGQTDSAIFYIDSCLSISRRNGDLRTIAHNYKNLSECYAAINQYETAYGYLLQAMELTDSSTNEIMLSRVQALSIAFETERKEKENALLAADNRLKLSELKTSKRTNVALIIGLLLTAGATFVFLLQKKRVNRAYKDLVLKNIEVVRAEEGAGPPVSTQVTEEKYQSSGLLEDQKNEIAAAIQKSFVEDKVYLDPELTLNKLSDSLGISRSYVSQVVNEKFGSNFNALTNEYRVKESRRLLSSGEYANYTIEAISQMVGFNSKSSFNAAFKKFTGTTPSFFQRNVRKK